MGVVLAEHLAHHPRRLLVGAVERQPQVLHGVEHAAVHGLEAVADVGQRAAHDDGHGVVQVGLPHLLFDRNRDLALVRHDVIHYAT